ncbi:MAG: CotH kinase family protein, partial [Eubacteriales bacterium]|nr:CotH kinase family protein [Eubacteriales bacterium]
MVAMRALGFMVVLIMMTCSLTEMHVKAGEILTDTYESKLPVAYIDTEDGAGISSKTEYKTAHMTIVGNEKYPGILYDGTISIKGRGNSTWLLPKKPYKIKLGTSTDMFGFGKNKHWVLLANYYDDSLMRNTLAEQVAEIMGLQSMQTEWVDVVLNGEYVGNYQFSEQIRVGENRIEIFDWEDEAEKVAKAIYQREKGNGFTKEDRDALEERMQENLAWITGGAVTYGAKTYKIADYYDLNKNYNGGYLIEFSQEYDEISKFKTADNVPTMIHAPEYVNTNSQMFAYIQEYIQQFENATYSPDGYTEIQGNKIHYSQLADFNSMINYWLLNEIMGNSDAFKKSCYAYKDVDGLLTFGPPWDFDWAEGAITVGSTYDRWEINRITDVGNFMKHWLQDPYYLVKAQERYWEIRPELDVMTAQDGLLESYYDYVKESGHANNTIWNLYWGFEKDYGQLKKYLDNHLAWLDEQMETEDRFLESLEAYQRSENMTLQLLDTARSEVPEDDTTDKASADTWMDNAEDLQLMVYAPCGTVSEVRVYVNGKYVDTSAMEDGMVCVP